MQLGLAVGDRRVGCSWRLILLALWSKLDRRKFGESIFEDQPQVILLDRTLTNNNGMSPYQYITLFLGRQTSR